MKLSAAVSELKRFHFTILMKEIKFITARSQANLNPSFFLISHSLLFINLNSFVNYYRRSVEVAGGRVKWYEKQLNWSWELFIKTSFVCFWSWNEKEKYRSRKKNYYWNKSAYISRSNSVSTDILFDSTFPLMSKNVVYSSELSSSSASSPLRLSLAWKFKISSFAWTQIEFWIFTFTLSRAHRWKCAKREYADFRSVRPAYRAPIIFNKTVKLAIIVWCSF